MLIPAVMTLSMWALSSLTDEYGAAGNRGAPVPLHGLVDLGNCPAESTAELIGHPIVLFEVPGEPEIDGATLATFAAVHKSYADRGLIVLAVIGEPGDKLASYIEETSWNLPFARYDGHDQDVHLDQTRLDAREELFESLGMKPPGNMLRGGVLVDGFGRLVAKTPDAGAYELALSAAPPPHGLWTWPDTREVRQIEKRVLDRDFCAAEEACARPGVPREVIEDVLALVACTDALLAEAERAAAGEDYLRALEILDSWDDAALGCQIAQERLESLRAELASREVIAFLKAQRAYRELEQELTAAYREDCRYQDKERTVRKGIKKLEVLAGKAEGSFAGRLAAEAAESWSALIEELGARPCSRCGKPTRKCRC